MRGGAEGGVVGELGQRVWFAAVIPLPEGRAQVGVLAEVGLVDLAAINQAAVQLPEPGQVRGNDDLQVLGQVLDGTAFEWERHGWALIRNCRYIGPADKVFSGPLAAMSDKKINPPVAGVRSSAEPK